MDEEKVIITCPNKYCQQKLRLPKTDKVLIVSCPKCRTSFRYKFPSIIERLKLRWYYRSWFIILLLVLFAPAGIILLWSGSKFRLPTRIGLSIAFGLLFIVQSISYVLTPPYRDYLFLSQQKTGTEEVYLPRVSVEPIKIVFGRLREEGQVLTIPEIVKKVERAIVSIESQDQNHKILSRGSGVVIHPSGIIITNYHILEGAHFAKIKLHGDKTCQEVFLVDADKQKDLAVLKIKASNLIAAPLGDSNKIEIGEKVVAIGNPLGYERTVSDGIISGLREEKGMKYLQITTPISPGSSGGALLNMYGEVIGITSMGYLGFAQNLNFAVPINYVCSLIKIKEQGLD